MPLTPARNKGDSVLRRAALVSLALTLANVAGAQEMAAPRIERASIDWARAAADAAPGGLRALNAAADRRFAGIARSAVPVLLPVDVGALRKPPDDADNVARGGFAATRFFQAGPAGYDAAFSIRTADVPEFSDIDYAKPVYVLLSGFRFIYALDGPALPAPAPVKTLESEFPGARRVWHEFYLRTIFERYGATYVVSIFCRDVRPSAKILSCAQAARIADRFAANLTLAGGAPEADRSPLPPGRERPMPVSSEFTFYPPGSLIPGTGRTPQLGGRSDRTVYADLRFPLKEAPAFANSQSFNNWGDCDFTGRSPRRVRAKGAPYVCNVNGRALVFDEGAGANYRYPWRDDFCEHRRFQVGQCPGGEGHQGQDIRPSFCKKINAGADRCEAYQQDVVAAADGMILRPHKQEAVLLFVNSPDAHLRLRYMHMSPQRLDAAGMLSGRRVERGEVLASVGNYDEYEHGTTYHLHFDMQVPTSIGYVFVNPYMTLVASYEHLLGARGTELVPEPPAETTHEMDAHRTQPVPLPPPRVIWRKLEAPRERPRRAHLRHVRRHRHLANR